MLYITCPFGLTSLLTTELKRLKVQPKNSYTNGCEVDSSSRKDITKINLWTRIGNTVYLELARKKIHTFDDLFDAVHTINRSSYIRKGDSFRIIARTTESKLHAPRTIQSIAHKAVATQLTGSREATRKHTQDHLVDIMVSLNNNLMKLYVNTSGDSLHKRGRRVAQGEAPIKENLAAAVILQAGRPFSQPLWDPTCGSGTLLIEAAYFARNIAPGSKRNFAFEKFPTYPTDLLEKEKALARKKEIDKRRTIIGTDKDPDMVSVANRNARSAGVEDIVRFAQHDVLSSSLPDPLDPEQATTIVSNPPYEKRMKASQAGAIHRRLKELVEQPRRNGAVISGFEDGEDIFGLQDWKRKESRQGKERCYIWMKKGR